MSESHYVVVTSDDEVLTWGKNTRGELGLGDKVRKLRERQREREIERDREEGRENEERERKRERDSFQIERLQPTSVDILSGRKMRWVAAGRGFRYGRRKKERERQSETEREEREMRDYFSLFCASRGTLLYCGRKDLSGTGPKEADVLKPILIDVLLRLVNI